jgi:ABC-2 type transport system permease protein
MSAISAPALRRPGPGRGRAGIWSSLTGARELTRLAIRRDRILLPCWIYALTIIAVSGGYGLRLIYKTAASRATLAASADHNKALGFLYGQLHGTSLGDLAAWRYLSYAALFAGLMSIFLVIRHSRADEETGRLELVGSTAVGRHAPLAVALTVAFAANFVVCVLAAAILSLAGLGVSGAVAFALGEASCGLTFAALAAIAAQVSSSARGARGIAITVLAVTFFFRGVGDSGGSHGLSSLTWLSPIGWAEEMRPFAAERWWVLALPAAATVAGIAAAYALAAHRDQGAGLVQPRPGSPTAGPLLAGPFGLDWRLMRGSIAGWAAGFLAGGLAIGVVAKGIGQLIGQSGAIDRALQKIAGQPALVDAYLAACMSLLALIASAYAVSAVLRLRSEESDGRAEPLLAAPVNRLRWAGSHLLLVALATTGMLVITGVGMALGYGIASSTLSTQLPRLIEAGLGQIPGVLLVAAIAFLFTGVLPRWSMGAGWAAVGICGIVGVLGPAFNLPQGVLDISPFTHAPKLPGGVVGAAPLLWLSAITVALTVAGLAGLRRRDIG